MRLVSRTKIVAAVALIAPFLLVVHASAGRQAPTPLPDNPLKISPFATDLPKEDRATYQEDFSKLPLAENKLKLSIEVLGEKDDMPDKPFIRERWHLVWRPGDPIDVYIVKPRNVPKPPVVLYLYSYPQDTDRFKDDYWCGTTTGNGFAAVGFVSAVTGQRTEYRSLKDDFFNQLPESMGATVHDVQMILNYLESRGDFDMTRVGMLGQGSGGGIGILASAVDPRIKVLDVLTPWGDWPTFLAKSTFVPSEEIPALNKPEFLKTVSGVDPVDWFPKVQARSVRIQDIRKDGHMPDDAQKAMEQAAPPTTEIDQFGDGAAFVPAAENGKLLDWVRQQLAPDAKPLAVTDSTQRVHYYPPQMPTNPLDLKHQ
jgi:hypothetical protein